MNAYALLVGVLLWGASTVGAFLYGRSTGIDTCQAQQAREEAFGRIAAEHAAAAAASAIANIEVKQVTIRQQLQKEIVEKAVFKDCRSGPDAVRLLNDAIKAPSDAASSSR